MTAIPRGKYKGQLVGAAPDDDGAHVMTCPACGGEIDCRDLGAVFEHVGPLPHATQPIGKRLDS